MLSLHLQNHDICLHKADLDPDGLTSLWRATSCRRFLRLCAQADCKQKRRQDDNEDPMPDRSSEPHENLSF